MRHILTILATLCFLAATAQAQTVKAIGFNTTNGQVVANTGTNVSLTFTNEVVKFASGDLSISNQSIVGTGVSFSFEDGGFEAGATIVRENLGFSTNLNTLWTATNASNARSAVGLGATWLTNTNVTNFRTAVGLGATNDVGFGSVTASQINSTTIGTRVIDLENNALTAGTNYVLEWSPTEAQFNKPITFVGTNTAATTRTNLGLGTTNSVQFGTLNVTNLIANPTANIYSLNVGTQITFNAGGSISLPDGNGIVFTATSASYTRTNLGLGATNIVTFAGLTNNGDIHINQTTATNGLLYIYRTNNEAFLGLANLIASNNTTVSNETLFRVGVAEATNKSAQFGFRATNTNGNGVAVFSVFGFNALMMIGADASTNAVIYSGGGTNNEVMTLIRDGATEFARPLRFSTNAASKPSTNAPANTTNVAAWVEMQIGTNSYRLPLYQ